MFESALLEAEKAMLCETSLNYKDAFHHYEMAIKYLQDAYENPKHAHCRGMLSTYIDSLILRKREMGIKISEPESLDREDTTSIQTSAESVSSGNDSLQTKFKSCIMKDCDKTSFSNVCGLEEEKLALEQAIILPSMWPSLFRDGRKPLKTLLFYGPPVTGKTELAKAIAGEMKDSTFLSVSCSDLTSKWVGESEKMVRDLFAFAHSLGGIVILYLDEIDSISSKRSEENDPAKNMKSELLVKMQTASNPNSNIVLLGSTNLPWDMDIGILRRFHRLIHVPLPNMNTRKEMLKKLLFEPNGSSITQKNIDDIAKRTNGLSGADIDRLCTRARNLCIDRIQRAHYFREKRPGLFVACEKEDPGAIKMRIVDIKGAVEMESNLCIDDVMKTLATIKNCSDSAYELKMNDFVEKQGEGLSTQCIAPPRDSNFVECVTSSIINFFF